MLRCAASFVITAFPKSLPKAKVQTRGQGQGYFPNEISGISESPCTAIEFVLVFPAETICYLRHPKKEK
jgi:hypothetical protein